MALKVLLLRKKLTEQQATLRTLEQTAEGFATREAELEADIEAAQTEEERSAVENAVTTFENERTANTEAQAQARTDIEATEAEIREAEEAAKNSRSGKPAGQKRKDERIMENAETRTRFFGMTVQQRDAFMARDDVKDFLTRVRGLKGQTRDVKGAELGIPEVMLDVLRENITQYSKLISKVRFRGLKGRARQNIIGEVPEAVWTEATGALNELSFQVTQLEIDGYKVGGFIAVPNSTLEDDDDLSLASEIMAQIAAALGRGIDRAVVYGDGAKKPVGWITRLKATQEPAWWGSNQGEFTDLHTSHVLKINAVGKSGAEFFMALIGALAVAEPKYSMSGVPTWIMNRKTHMDVLARALAFNASGALVAGMQNTMPVIGGEIIELEFMSDYEISGGFLDCYSLVERAGASIRSSDIPLMLQDQTVFVGTQRMDGKPSIGEAFVHVSYDNTEPTGALEFAPDYANTELGILTVTSAASATASGKTAVTVAGNTAGAVLKYKVAAQAVSVENGKKPGSGWTAYAAGTEITAATGSYITVVELDAAGNIVKAGSAVVTAKA